MAGEPFRTINLFSAETVPVVDGQLEWLPVRRRLGGKAFGTNAYRAEKAGDLIIEDHVESPGQEEMYVVIRGGVRFTVDGEEVDGPAGTALYLPDPDVRRSGVAVEDETVVLAVGGWPDRPYRSLPWEPLFLAEEAMRAGEWARAVETIEREAEHTRDHPRVRYRLAYCLAQAGESERARDELRAAIERDPGLAERAAQEDAFADLDLDSEAVEVVRRVLSAWERGDFAAEAELLHPDVRFETFMPDASDNFVAAGAAEVSAFTRDWLAQWRDYRILVDHLEPVGAETVFAALQQRAEGRQSGVLVESAGFSVWRVRDGQVTAFSLHYDRDEALAAAGLR